MNGGPTTRDCKLNDTRVLYLSYDGMCDPLGQAQVLPYLSGLGKRGHRISLVSFEKPDRSEAEREEVRRACTAAWIDWHPLPYHKRPPLLSSMYDVRAMSRLAERLHADEPFDLIHCRSYLPALVGLSMKRRFGVPFIFDMRGFWADERVDGRIWNLSNPLFRAVFRYFKRREAEFLAEAAQVISLTEAGETILLDRRGGRDGPPITVIPCCVDFAAFPPVSKAERARARGELGIDPNATVTAYLGSLGGNYMLDAMLDFFKVQLERDPGARFLIVSREPAEQIRREAENRGIPAERIIVRPASRVEVPQLLAAADYGIAFKQPSFSAVGCSPTKLGEFLSMELPVVANGGVGDVEPILRESGAGVLVDEFGDAAYRKALDELAALKPDMKRWRSAARRWFDLDAGVERYDNIYAAIANGGVGRRQEVR